MYIKANESSIARRLSPIAVGHKRGEKWSPCPWGRVAPGSTIGDAKGSRHVEDAKGGCISPWGWLSASQNALNFQSGSASNAVVGEFPIVIDLSPIEHSPLIGWRDIVYEMDLEFEHFNSIVPIEVQSIGIAHERLAIDKRVKMAKRHAALLRPRRDGQKSWDGFAINDDPRVTQ